MKHELLAPAGSYEALEAALAAGADAVLPIEAGNKISARIAHYRYTQLAHHVDHVLTEALCVCRRVLRLIDAAVNRAAKMLDE